MVFPDDEREANPASFKFLEMAHKWKRMQATGGTSSLLSSSRPPAATRGPPEHAAISRLPEENEDKDSVMDSSSSDSDE